MRGHRDKSAGALADDARRAFDGATVLAGTGPNSQLTTDGPTSDLTPAVPHAAQLAAAAHRSDTEPRRRRTLALAAAISTLLLLAGVVIATTRLGEPSDATAVTEPAAAEGAHPFVPSGGTPPATVVTPVLTGNERCHPFVWTKSADDLLDHCRPGQEPRLRDTEALPTWLIGLSGARRGGATNE